MSALKLIPIRRAAAFLAAVLAGLVPMQAHAAKKTPPARALPAALQVWPNAVSRANSDLWLVQHADQIRRMRPRVLVINFSDGLSSADAAAKAAQLIGAIAEGSRYHGYRNKKAPVFLQYQIAKTVNLTDEEARKAEPDGNSSFYPRNPKWAEGNDQPNLAYDKLFSPEFAAYYGYRDPQNSSRFLTLADLVKRGLVNEVWFLAIQGKYGSPYESVEVKQAYNDRLRPIPGKWVQAGNGSTDLQPWIGRSLRILFINSTRGVGCAMESLSHSIEGTSNSGAIPYFTRYFVPYADFDLDKKYHVPFTSLYGHGSPPVRYPDSTTAIVTDKGKEYTLHPYVATGGNVHYCPGARQDYDLSDYAVSVMSTIEHYRMHDGPDGKDKAALWNVKIVDQYAQVAPDCQGRWLVYWRQNFPGYQNQAQDDAGKPMRNWWPFLFF